MIIDIHVHAFPDKIAAKALESLSAVYGVKCFSDGTIKGLLDYMAGSGVDVSVVQPVSTDPRQVVSINTWASSLPQIGRERGDASNNPVIGFGTIHPKFEGYREEIQRMKELGIKGVKFQPSFQEFYPDDERMFPVYEEIVKAGMVILFHAGDEIQPAPIVYSTPPRLARVLDAIQAFENQAFEKSLSKKEGASAPESPAKIIAAHLGGYRMWDQVEEYLVGRDLYFDISYVFGHLDFDRAIRIIRSHGVDQIVFGSDLPFARQETNIQTILKLDMAQDDKEKILGKNISRLLCLS